MPQVLFQVVKSKPINWQAFKDEIDRTLEREVKPAVLAYFERVTKPWKHPPTFKAIQKVTQDSVTVSVVPTGPNADIWRYVSQGTRPHIIIPRHARALRFLWGGPGSYKPRTTTGGGYLGPGRVTGGKTVFRTFVNHPGNKARNFEKYIARWYAPQFRRTMKNAVARATRRARA